jgi:UDP-2,4-diacetamido-2,4,6-trideoxy-beta-L-altropyranose hydrolase
MMRVAVRADASRAIGAGHVMRCLSLAEGLRNAGARVTFVCRAHEGHLGDTIANKGFPHVMLPISGTALGPGVRLGADISVDAADTCAALEWDGGRVDWLIVDHYGTNAAWDTGVRAIASRLLVIDDLMETSRNCDVLVNQNVPGAAAAYVALIPSGCRVLAGPRYALLRSEFVEARRRLPERRPSAPVRQILISLGGMDSDNVTTRVLDALRAAAIPPDVALTVVLGPTAPWVDTVRRFAATLPWSVDVRVGVTSMAQMALEADLAVGAAGSSSWERCVVGLPSVMIVVADNQAAPARTLDEAGAAVVLKAAEIETHLARAVTAVMEDPSVRVRLSGASAALVDGQGVARVVREMIHAA